MILLCILACCNLSGCGRINFIAPEKKMESYLERKYDEENPDIVVTCGYGDNFDDNYRDELFRKQFKELMYEYSSQFFTGEYYVWISWDERTEPIDEKQTFEEYIKDDPRFAIDIYVEDMNKEEARDATTQFRSFLRDKGIQNSCWAARNYKYDIEEFRKIMTEDPGDFEAYYNEDVSKGKELLDGEWGEWKPNDKSDYDGPGYWTLKVTAKKPGKTVLRITVSAVLDSDDYLWYEKAGEEADFWYYAEDQEYIEIPITITK